MKKLLCVVIAIAILVTAGMLFFRTKDGKIGETYTSQDVEFTVNTLEFAEVIDGWGGANDDFWKPLNSTNCNIGLRWPTVEAYALAHGLAPKSENDRIFFVSYTAKNVGKTDKTFNERGELNYNDGYKYNDAQFAYRVSEEGVWQELPGGIKIEKLNTEAYEFRAYFVVPAELMTSDNPVTYSLYGYKFTVK